MLRQCAHHVLCDFHVMAHTRAAQQSAVRTLAQRCDVPNALHMRNASATVMVRSARSGSTMYGAEHPTPPVQRAPWRSCLVMKKA